jgi:hypothetical protein
LYAADINPFEPLAAFQDAVYARINEYFPPFEFRARLFDLYTDFDRAFIGFLFCINPAIYRNFAGSKSLSPQALNQFRFRKRYHIDPPGIIYFCNTQRAI